MNFNLSELNQNEIKQFKKYMQESFQKGFEAYYGKTDYTILPEEDIDSSLNKDGSVAYKAVVDEEIAGGAVVVIDKESGHNHLELLFVRYSMQNKGIGFKIWSEIEKIYPETITWETCTPYFDKRNIHFYVNLCGFHIVKFYNSKCPNKDMPLEHSNNGCDEMFEFIKYMR